MGFLTAGDRQEWADAFNDAFSDLAKLDQVVRFTQRLTLEQVAGTGPLTDVVVRLIARADDEGWAPGLARTALAANPGREKLGRVVHRIEIREQLDDPNPYKAIRMLGQPMLDRETLRAAIEMVERDTASRVFVIEGHRLSGKSYTIQFLTFISLKQKSFTVVPVDLELQFRIAGGAVRADRITKAIVNKLGLSAADLATMPAFAEEQEARYVLEFGEWLAGVLGRLETRICFVFDHFSKALLTQGSSDLVIEVCRQAFQTTNLTVVLLEFDRVGDLQAALGRIVDHSVISTIDPIVMRRDLTRFFTAMIAERQVLAGGEPTDAIVDLAAQATQNVLVRVTEGEDRMLELRTAVADELHRLDEAPVVPVAPAPGAPAGPGGGPP